ELFSEIQDLGTIERLDGGQAAEGLRRFRVRTTSSDADLLDLFTFHIDRERIRLQPISDGYGFHEGAPGAPGEGTPAQAEHDHPAAASAADEAAAPTGDADSGAGREADFVPSEVTVERRAGAPDAAQPSTAAARTSVSET